MKIEKFLISMAEKIRYNTNIHLPTFKMVLKAFYEYLSKKQKERWELTIQLITSFTSKQESIKETLERIKTNNLENKLKQLQKRK